MSKKSLVNALYGTAVLLASLTCASNAHAQLLYKSYDYSNREQYQTMQTTPPPPPPVQQQSYVPDPILTPRTNQILSQGTPQPTRYQPMAAPLPMATILPVSTITGVDLGIQVSDYRYQEHVSPNTTFMRLTGANFGGTLDGTIAYTNGWFWNAGMRVAYGQFDYAGGDINLSTGATTPSTHDNEDNWLLDSRVVGGHDFVFPINGRQGAYDISPYAGLGFRFLYNDARGADTNGVSGYERYSQYIYFPVGLTQRVKVEDDSRVALNFEFDDLLYGWEVSQLNETIPGAGSLRNSQGSGYGLRGSLMYEWPKWSLGPFFNYWNVNQSDSACTNSNVGLVCGAEPHNQTIEYGLHLKYRFTEL
jgi:hypothetical protein